MSKRHKPQPARRSPPLPERTYQGGCARTLSLSSDAPDLAFTALEFPECPSCPHRVEPEGATPFCTWRPQSTAHPFAALAVLDLPDDA